MKTKKSEDLIFNYGSMGSGKTALLLRKYYNCTQDNEIPVLLLKPSIDDRYGEDIIQSRIGIFAPAISINKATDIEEIVNNQKEHPHIIMLDEVQFLTSSQIEQLKSLSDNEGILIDAYGLKINFRGNLFGEETGTIKKLLEVNTRENYIQSYCTCGNDATHIARYNPNTWEIQTEGPEILIGGNERYVGLCHRCWNSGFIPRPSRLKVYSKMIKEELSKGNEVNNNRLIELRKLIENEQELITDEEIFLNQKIEKDARKKIISLYNSKKR